MFEKTTRDIVTGKRPREEEIGVETKVQGRSAAGADVPESGEPLAAETKEVADDGAASTEKKTLRLPEWLIPAACGAVCGALLMWTVLGVPKDNEPVAPAVDPGQSIVAVPADSMLTGEVDSGDVVRLYNHDGMLIRELQYVEVYGADETGLLLLMDEEQAEVLVSQKTTPKVVLAAHNDAEKAAELLERQGRVNDPEVKLRLQESLTLPLLEQQRPEYTVTLDPVDGVQPKIFWSSSDPVVAKVGPDGEIVALSVGQTTITAECGGKRETCVVDVVIPLLGVDLDLDEKTLYVGETVTLTAIAEPKDATNFDVVWRSADTAIATVAEDGTVTGVSAGTTTITAVSGEFSASCTVTVGVHAESVALDKTTLTLTQGETGKLTATVTPATGVLDSDEWTSSDPMALGVLSDGSLLATFPGTVTITYRCGDATATCTVEVVEPGETTAE